jgi:hypothetical protein
MVKFLSDIAEFIEGIEESLQRDLMLFLFLPLAQLAG